MNKLPLVSITMITYNHELYIEDAINGVLMQKTDFDLELIIGNDQSPDRTDEIVKKCIENYSGNHVIKYFFYEKNKGVMDNFLFLLKQTRGKYIATCEGDDYWTDPFKLQKQVDLMEANPQYSICFHNALIKYEDQSIEDKLFCTGFKNLQVFTIRDIIHRNWFCPSASMLLRSDRLPGIPDWASKVYNGDLMVQLLLSANGNMVYLDDTMSVYRQNAGNLSSIKKAIPFYNNRIISLLLKFNRYSNYKYARHINRRIAQLYIKSIKSTILFLLSKFKKKNNLGVSSD